MLPCYKPREESNKKNTLLPLVWQYSHTNFINSINYANSEVTSENDEHLTQVTAQIAHIPSGNKAERPFYCIIMEKGEVKRGLYSAVPNRRCSKALQYKDPRAHNVTFLCFLCVKKLLCVLLVAMFQCLHNLLWISGNFCNEFTTWHTLSLVRDFHDVSLHR
jgi:hypothetical protein